MGYLHILVCTLTLFSLYQIGNGRPGFMDGGTPVVAEHELCCFFEYPMRDKDCEHLDDCMKDMKNPKCPLKGKPAPKLWKKGGEKLYTIQSFYEKKKDLKDLVCTERGNTPEYEKAQEAEKKKPKIKAKNKNQVVCCFFEYPLRDDDCKKDVLDACNTDINGAKCPLKGKPVPKKWKKGGEVMTTQSQYTNTEYLVDDLSCAKHYS